MAEVVQMADLRDDNRLITPEGTLLDALDQLQRGSKRAEKLVVVFLDTRPNGERYSVNYLASNITGSEMVALLETLKACVLRDMGF